MTPKYNLKLCHFDFHAEAIPKTSTNRSNTRSGPGAGSRLDQQLICWPNIKRSLRHSIVVSGSMTKPIRQLIQPITGCRLETGSHLDRPGNNFTSGPHLDQTCNDFALGFYVDQICNDFALGFHLDQPCNDFGSGFNLDQNCNDFTSSSHVDQICDDFASGFHLDQTALISPHVPIFTRLQWIHLRFFILTRLTIISPQVLHLDQTGNDFTSGSSSWPDWQWFHLRFFILTRLTMISPKFLHLDQTGNDFLQALYLDQTDNDFTSASLSWSDWQWFHLEFPY